MIVTNKRSKAICILGMHRSGTSTVARSINLLGAYLGERSKLGKTGPDNPKGFWEHTGIRDIETRLMKRLGREWDDTMPLPEGWLESAAALPFRKELARLVKKEFAEHPLWAWKDPRSCLLLPLWRSILEEVGTQLTCVFVVRSPMDVASSLVKRNELQAGHAMGLWYYYNLVALRDVIGLPVVFSSYEALLTNWEPELRRCAMELGLEWPANDKQLRAEMDDFIDPTLRHHQASPQHLQKLPKPVRELFQILSNACGVSSMKIEGQLEETVNRLYAEYYSYASFFPYRPLPPPPTWFDRTTRRWKRSIRKRLPKALATPLASNVAPSSS